MVTKKKPGTYKVGDYYYYYGQYQSSLLVKAIVKDGKLHRKYYRDEVKKDFAYGQIPNFNDYMDLIDRNMKGVVTETLKDTKTNGIIKTSENYIQEMREYRTLIQSQLVDYQAVQQQTKLTKAEKDIIIFARTAKLQGLSAICKRLLSVIDKDGNIDQRISTPEFLMLQNQISKELANDPNDTTVEYGTIKDKLFALGIM